MAAKTTVKLSKGASRRSAAAANGRAFGVLLGESAAQILLNEFAMRSQPTTPASEQYLAAWELLQSALGETAKDPAVAAALKQLDEAYGEALVEMEDRTWHAAWHTAMGLITGATLMRTNSHDANGIGSRKRSD